LPLEERAEAQGYHRLGGDVAEQSVEEIHPRVGAVIEASVQRCAVIEKV
jgi:hypothetical protein